MSERGLDILPRHRAHRLGLGRFASPTLERTKSSESSEDLGRYKLLFGTPSVDTNDATDASVCCGPSQAASNHDLAHLLEGAKVKRARGQRSVEFEERANRVADVGDLLSLAAIRSAVVDFGMLEVERHEVGDSKRRVLLGVFGELPSVGLPAGLEGGESGVGVGAVEGPEPELAAVEAGVGVAASLVPLEGRSRLDTCHRSVGGVESVDASTLSGLGHASLPMACTPQVGVPAQVGMVGATGDRPYCTKPGRPCRAS